jgi:hypothetical protein
MRSGWNREGSTVRQGFTSTVMETHFKSRGCPAVYTAPIPRATVLGRNNFCEHPALALAASNQDSVGSVPAAEMTAYQAWNAGVFP